MNPQIQSILTSIAGMAAAAVATWLVKSNIIPADQIDGTTATIATLIAGAIGAGIVWIKSLSHTPAALTAAVNSDAVPGVKVVPKSTPGPAVNATNDGKTTPAP